MATDHGKAVGGVPQRVYPGLWWLPGTLPRRDCLFDYIFFLKDQYYSVQTTEGEQISALIAGYIDIILKRRQRKERFGEDGNEEEYLEESFIHPGRAIEIHGLPQTLKKAKPDSLAKPGLLRNSGGKF